MLWMLFVGLLFGGSMAVSGQAEVGLPACPSIDAQAALQAHFHGAQVRIAHQEMTYCNNMKAVMEVEAYVNGEKMEIELIKQGTGGVQVKIKQRYNHTYRYNGTMNGSKGFNGSMNASVNASVKAGFKMKVVVVADGKASFWFLKEGKVVKIANGLSAFCNKDADEVWVARKGYAVKQIELDSKGCYRVDFKNDKVTVEAECKKRPLPVEPLKEEIQMRLRAKLGMDVKVVEVEPEANGKVKVKYKAPIKIPFLGITLPIETVQEAEISLES